MFIKIYKFIWEQKKLLKGEVRLILFLLLISAVLADVLAPYIVGHTIDKFSIAKPGMGWQSLWEVFGVLWIGYVLCRYLSTVSWSIMRGTFSYVEAKTLENTENKIRSIMFEKSMDFFNKRFAGAITNKESRFTRSYERLFDEFVFNIWPTVWRFTGVIVMLLFVAPLFAWMFIGYAVVYLSFTTFYSRYKFQFDVRASKINSKMTGIVADIYTNILAIKLFASEKYEQGKFNHENHQRFLARMKSWELGNLRDNIMSFFNDTVLIVILTFALFGWNKGTITAGSVVLLFTYSNQIRMYMFSLGSAIKNSMSNYSEMVEMMTYIESEPDIKDPQSAAICEINKGEIIFDSVSFHYPGTEKKVFENFSLHIPSGQKLGLVGHSGSGKTSFVSLIPRLYDIISGTILIDGQKIDTITQTDLRRKVSMISQEPVLFHRSVREIIQNDNGTVGIVDIENAAKLAYAHDFISNDLENGYDTIVGERGVMLSGGQKQRVAIARALLEKTPILILDEATSAMDGDSEKKIQLALEQLLQDQGRTMIVIAHRLSTVMELDRVIVFDDGKIIEDGTPLDLLEKKGQFYKLWRSQQNKKTLKYQLQLLTEEEKKELFAADFSRQKITENEGLVV